MSLTLEVHESEARVVANGVVRATFPRGSGVPEGWWQGPLRALLFAHEGALWRWSGEAFEALPPEEEG